jgi:prepilin-type N-terminal cleavage/methylation domain-containing protein
VKNIKKRLRMLAGDESGMTLIEVVVAIVIMVAIATSAAAVSLNGTKTESIEERAQVAVTIANSFMETVSGTPVATDTHTGASFLYGGRTKQAVTDAFNAYASQPGVAQTNPVWDPLDPAAVQVDQPKPTLEITTTPTTLPAQNGTQYTVTTLIGSCYQSTTVQSYGTSSTPVLNNCVAASGTNTTQLIRVIVIVKWTAGAQCATNGCFYDTSTLIDPRTDLEWVTH